MGLPIVFFDKCIGRKRNVDGGVLAGLSSSDAKPNETSAVLRFFKLPFSAAARLL